MNEDRPPDDPFEPTQLWDLNAPEGGVIGPYRLVQKLGEGGMGQVWLAQQIEPIRRSVAIKIIKAGMDTGEVIRRFESERRTLALMDHPCIAKVYDAGATPQGRPYFAMEYVRGTPIQQYCDSRRLKIDARLALFQGVCDGVQHAHQKAIIHRDLKSSNVLVTEIDGVSVPKIIDFGLAKAIGPRISAQTEVTALGRLMGTPEYMSPEQADFIGEDIDTRTDIYALGVVLYRLLTGEFPFDPQELRRAGLEGMRRIIRETDPPRPSARVMTLRSSADPLKARRHTDSKRLSRQLRGDLDWIVMKALEKDRNRRYDSPQEFSRDVQRHLQDRPVVAGPPGRRYRTRKFVRRHRTAVGLSLGGLAVLLAFLSMTLVQSRRVERQAIYARQVADFMTNLFLEFDPVDRGSTITLREILDEGARRAREELVDQPMVQARLMSTIGSVYRNLALYDEATPLLAGAARILDGRPGRKDERLGMALVEWAINERVLGRYDRADSLYHLALPILGRTLGPQDPDVGKTLHGMAVLNRSRGRLEEAEGLYRQALEVQRTALGDEHPDVAKTLSDLAVCYFFQGRLEEAETTTREALAIREKVLPPNHASLGESYNNLGAVLRARGDLAEAARLLQRALEIRVAALGPEHSDVAQSHGNLAGVFQALGEPAKALEHLEAALVIFQRTLGPDHPRVGDTLERLARHWREQGQADRALEAVRRSLEIQEAARGRDDPAVVTRLLLMGEIQADLGDLPSADARFRRAIEIQEHAGESEASGLESTREQFAAMLERTGRTTRADSLRSLPR